MAIAKITNNIVDGTTKLGKSTFEPYKTAINALIDAVDGLTPVVTKILVAAEPDNAEHGSVAVHGLDKKDYDCAAYYAEVGEYVTLHAKDGADYSFKKWVDSANKTISGNKDQTILVTSAMSSGVTYKAIFEGSTVTIGATSESSTKGSVKINGEAASSKNVTKNNQVTLTALANDYYEFSKWQKKNASGTYEDVTGATSTTYTFNATENAEYKAVFVAKQIGEIEVEVSYDDTTKKVKITKLSAENAKSLYIVNGTTETLYSATDAAAGTYEYSSAVTLSFKATSDISGVTEKTASTVTLEVDADTNTLKCKSTHQMLTTTVEEGPASPDNYDDAYNAGSYKTLSNGDEISIYSNGKNFEISVSNS